jgi:hypothetical protein
LSTAHPSITTAFLVQETDLQNLGAGLVQWTRRYATVPATRSEYESFAYTFPAYLAGAESDPMREPLTRSVQSRVEYAYFHVGTALVPTVADIELAQRQRYVFPPYGDSDKVHSGTEPTLTEYLEWVDEGRELVAEDARCHAWLGNIYERITRYIIAQ